MHQRLSTNKPAVAIRLARTLSPYSKADGDYIHLVVLLDALPGHRWDLYLLGGCGTNKPGAVMRTQPLLGRTRQKTNVVVLESSLRAWINAAWPRAADVTMDGLRAAQRQYEAGLKQLREETRLKWGEPRGRKPRPRPIKQPKPPVVTSAALFGVWK